MKFSQIKEICIYCKDLENAKRFYHGKLGLPIMTDIAGKLVFFRAGSSVLLCFNPDYSKEQDVPPPHFAEGKQHIAFEVPKNEYSEYKDQLAKKDIEITYEHKWPNGMYSAYFDGPEGQVLEIVPEGLWDKL